MLRDASDSGESESGFVESRLVDEPLNVKFPEAQITSCLAQRTTTQMETQHMCVRSSHPLSIFTKKIHEEGEEDERMLAIRANASTSSVSPRASKEIPAFCAASLICAASATRDHAFRSVFLRVPKAPFTSFRNMSVSGVMRGRSGSRRTTALVTSGAG